MQHRTYEMRIIAIDDPDAWASVSLSLNFSLNSVSQHHTWTQF